MTDRGDGLCCGFSGSNRCCENYPTDHREAPAPTLGDEKTDMAKRWLEDAVITNWREGTPTTRLNLERAWRNLTNVLAERAEPDGALRVRPPTDAEVADACMWYRHDFGLLDEREREVVRFAAREWLRAWCKVRDYEMPPASAPQRAGTEGEKGERP